MRLAIGISMLALLLASCGSDQPKRDPNLDADALAAKSSIEMNALDSYRVRIIVPSHPEDVREEGVWETEFQAPDSYRLFFHDQEGESKEVCERDGPRTSCQDVLTSITRETTREVILVDDMTYFRICGEDGDGCDDWESRPRPDLLVLGLSSASLSGWPFVALEMLVAPEAVGAEKIEGVAVWQIRGSANHFRAILENQDRMLTDSGVASLFDECDIAAGLDMTEMVDECREQLTEQSLRMQEEGISFYDEHPATVNAWISAEGYLYRLEISAMLEGGGEVGTLMTFEYSQFNDVVIEAPQIGEEAE